MTQNFNDHQRRLWSKMLQIIAEYRDGKIGYSQMVGDLEGALDAGEFQDVDLRNKWYDFWTPLEISRATPGDEAKRSDVEEDVSRMTKFMEGLLAGDLSP